MIATVQHPRRNGRQPVDPPPAALIRTAIYTRKSVETEASEVLTSLEVQRELVEKYVESQRERGWQVLPERFDDNGFSGGSLSRPAIGRLLAEIEAGRVDAVAVYRLDRISRRQLDLLRLLELFHQRGIAFVSVTETLNSDTPAGRAMIHLLGVFAQLERETIAERTRDSMRAARRRGMFTGGRVFLGYRVEAGKLIVVPAEAALVREIFRLYRAEGSLSAVAQDLNRRGWKTKGGARWDKGAVHRLLRTPVVAGLMRAREETVAGQHEAIVSRQEWDAVQAMLDGQDRGRGDVPRQRSSALLAGALHCAACSSGMVYRATSAKGGRRTGYYECARYSREGAAACPGSRVPAGAIETAVVEAIRGLGADERLVAAVMEAARIERERQKADLECEIQRLEDELQKVIDEQERLVAQLGQGAPGAAAMQKRLAELDAAAQDAQKARKAAQGRLASLASEGLDQAHVRATLASWNELWGALEPRERNQVVGLLIEKVAWDRRSRDYTIRWRGKDLAGAVAAGGA